MNSKVKAKLRDFSKRHGLTGEQRARLGASLKGFSPAQAEIALRTASVALRTSRVRVRPSEPKLIEPAAPAVLGPDGRPAAS